MAWVVAAAATVVVVAVGEVVLSVVVTEWGWVAVGATARMLGGDF